MSKSRGIVIYNVDRVKLLKTMLKSFNLSYLDDLFVFYILSFMPNIMG